MTISNTTRNTIHAIQIHTFDDNLSTIASSYYETLKPYIKPSEFLYALFKTCKNNTAIKIALSITYFLESLCYKDFKTVLNSLKDDELTFHYFAHFLVDNCNIDPFEIVLHNPQLKPVFPFVPEYFLPVTIEQTHTNDADIERNTPLDIIKNNWIHLLN
ncbi:MAG: hypothetical protein HRT67_08960 [Flavobacteriaceae bacterium]|nr:hypothetical protein [Flavobacteriaceae bacterium]